MMKSQPEREITVTLKDGKQIKGIAYKTTPFDIVMAVGLGGRVYFASLFCTFLFCTTIFCTSIFYISICILYLNFKFIFHITLHYTHISK